MSDSIAQRCDRFDTFRFDLDGLEFHIVDLVDDQLRNGYFGYGRYSSIYRRQLVMLEFLDIADALTITQTIIEDQHS